MNNENNNAIIDKVLRSEGSVVNRFLLNYLSNNGALDNIVNETRAQLRAGHFPYSVAAGDHWYDEVLSSEESGLNRFLLNYLTNNGALDDIITETRAQLKAGQTTAEWFDQDRKLVKRWIQQLSPHHLQHSQELADVIENLAINIVNVLYNQKPTGRKWFDRHRKLVEDLIQQLLRPHLQYSQELPDIIENLAINILSTLANRKSIGRNK